MINIPGDDKRWHTGTASDLFGPLVRTRNMDFDKEGYASLARKAMALYSLDSDSDFGRLVAIAADASNYYFVTTNHIFSLAPTNSALPFTELTATNMPSLQVGSDAVQFGGALVISGSTSVTDWTGSAWTSAARITGFSSSYPHPLCVFENRLELAVANGNVVTTYNTSYVLQNTLTLPSKYVVVSMRWLRNNLFVGTRTTDGSDAMVFIWNGTGTTAQQGYPIGADWAYSLAPYQSSIAVLTSAGQCLRFNGGGFDGLFTLPIYYTNYAWSGDTGLSGVGKCLNRGMIAVGDVLFFNIDGQPVNNSGISVVNQPSGLWCYDPNVGPYHKAGYVTEVYRNLTISTLASSIFTMASAHGCETGDAVWASSVGNIAALTAGQVYYAIKVSTTALQLALSPADALAGRAVTASGTLSGDKLAFDDITTVGSTNGCTPGAVSGFSALRANTFFAADVFFGGTAADPDGNTINTLMSLGMGRNVGSFITAFLPAAGITDTFQKVFAKLKELNLSTDKVLVKYRLKERPGLPTPTRYQSGGKATWVDGTSFTIDTTKKDVQSALAGDEVEVVEGAAAGYTAHITSIDSNTSTFTYVVDETFVGGVNGDLSDLIIDNWKIADTFTSSSAAASDGFLQSGIDSPSTYIQLKFELRGQNISIAMLDIINAISKQRV